jgi:hypothetical protein
MLQDFLLQSLLENKKGAKVSQDSQFNDKLQVLSIAYYNYAVS